MLILKMIPFMILMMSCGTKNKSTITDRQEKYLNEDSIISNVPKIKFYLTFDDGPYQTTPGLISHLKSLNVKSNFFIVGSQVDYSKAYDSIFRLIKKTDIFKVYNHSYSHAVTHGRIHQYYTNPLNVVKDIQRNKDVINTGGNITRLPGMNTWRIGNERIRSSQKTKALMSFLNSNNIKENIVGWDVEWAIKHSKNKSEVDSLYKQIESIVRNDTSKIKNIVLLSHDYLYRDKASLNNLTYLIDKLKNELKCSFHYVEEMNGLFPAGE